MNKENIEAVLKDYQCTYMGTDLVSANTVKEIKVEAVSYTHLRAHETQ